MHKIDIIDADALATPEVQTSVDVICDGCQISHFISLVMLILNKIPLFLGRSFSWYHVC